MKKIILNALITSLVFGGAVVALAETEGMMTDDTTSTSSGGVVCTQEAKQCPDGSYVGRVGPKCEFKQCPQNHPLNTTKPTPPRPLQQLKDIRQETREEIKDARQETRMEIKDLKERMASSTHDLRDKIKENIQNRMGHRFDRMLARFQATIDREEKIMTKIVSRIEKVKANGGNTTLAETAITEARGHVAEAKLALENLKTNTNTAISQEVASTTRMIAKETMTAMRIAGGEIEKHLRLAHKALQKIVGILRGVSQLRNASSTQTKTDN